jgi:hypothetical protein
MRFELGELYLTNGISNAKKHDIGFYIEIMTALAYYISGEYGNIPWEDVQANEYAILNGLRVIGCYNTSKGDIYIITEADRSCTTILFCDEY